MLAFQMAVESTFVEAEMVDAAEFLDLADRYEVSGVPHTTINGGAGNIVGAVPEPYLLAEIRRVVETTSAKA